MTDAIAHLGTGFLRHPANGRLREDLDADLFKRALLRLVYRLLFWFVAEDRDVLLHPDADQTARAPLPEVLLRGRLRASALRRTGTAHGDLWQAVRLVLNALGDENGLPRLGLTGLGGIYDDTGTDQILRGLELSNEHLLAAVKSLARVHDKSARRWRRVDYRNLGAEELGSIYESLLELVPKWSKEKREFLLNVMPGNERKSTGSYYTPTSLIDCLLDSTLDPVLDDAQKRAEMAATSGGHRPVARHRRRPAGGHGLRPGLRLRTLPRRGRAAHRQAPGRGARAQPGTHRRGAAHRAARRGYALHLRRRRQPDGGRTGQGLAVAGGAGARQAARLPRRSHQIRQRAHRRDSRADRLGIPDKAFKAVEGDDPQFAASLERRTTPT